MGADRAVDAVLGWSAWAAVSGSSSGGRGDYYRLRTGIAWRDLPSSFGPHQTVSKRHRRFSADGTWDRIHARLVAEADAAGGVDWAVSVDSTINRAHQHATTMSRVERPAGRQVNGRTGG